MESAGAFAASYVCVWFNPAACNDPDDPQAGGVVIAEQVVRIQAGANDLWPDEGGVAASSQPASWIMVRTSYLNRL